MTVATFHLFCHNWLIEVWTDKTLISCCATMPICIAQAWQQYSLLLFCIWICIIHQTIRKAIDSPAGWLCITKWLPVSLHDYPSVSQSFCVPVNHPVSCQSVNPHCFLLASLKADCQSVKRTAGQLVSQSVSQSVCQSVSLSVSLSVYQPGSKLLSA